MSDGRGNSGLSFHQYALIPKKMPRMRN